LPSDGANPRNSELTCPASTNGQAAAHFAASPFDFFWSDGDLGPSHQDELETTAGILEDPFDAEWAALAMRNTVTKNPFLNDSAIRDSDSGLKKAFELQM
jgi:hypothetical protein